MPKKYISRREAADLIGVSTQTVSNYAERGMLTTDRTTKYPRYIRKEVLALRDNPKIKETEEIKKIITAYKDELESVKAFYREKVKEKRAMVLSSSGNWERYKDLINATIGTIASKTLSERERRIIGHLLDGRNYEEIGNAYDLTRERVRVIVIKAIRKMKEFPDLVKENESLKERIEALEENNANLRNIIDNMPARKTDGDDPNEEKYPYCLNISKLGLSTRCYNGLRSIDILTVRDIVNTPKREIQQIRNFGRKSFSEVENTLMRLDALPKEWEEEEKEPDKDILLSKYTSQIGFPAWYTLAKNNIRTLYDLMELSETELLGLENMNRQKFDKIEKFVNKLGLKIRK